MYNETTMTIVGNLTGTPRLRRLGQGMSVANFRVASTPRKFDRERGRHVDGNSLFMSVTCWRDLAENVAMSLGKGDPVVVTGRVQMRSFVKDGQSQSVIEMEATAVGPDLSKGVANFRRIYANLPGRGGEQSAERAVGDEAVGAGSMPEEPGLQESEESGLQESALQESALEESAPKNSESGCELATTAA